MVYGDIGTSPLYAFKECFFGPHSFPVTTGNVLGILSLIFWSLNFVVTFKYLSMVMRADNRGEGGILALLALVRPSGPLTRTGRLLINGAAQNITFNATGAFTTWATQNVTVNLNNGTVNTIRFESNGQDLANLDQVEVL